MRGSGQVNRPLVKLACSHTPGIHHTQQHRTRQARQPHKQQRRPKHQPGDQKERSPN